MAGTYPTTEQPLPIPLHIDDVFLVDTPLDLPATTDLIVGPRGTIEVRPGVTLTIAGKVYAPPTQHVFRGDGLVELAQDTVYVDWFGAAPGGINAHALRRALWAVQDGGEIVFARAGVYVAHDDADRRRAFAHNFGAEDFRPVKAAVQYYTNFVNGPPNVSWDSVTIRGQGRGTVVAAPPDVRMSAVSHAGYRNAGWLTHPDSVFRFKPLARPGQPYLELYSEEDARSLSKYGTAMAVNGASYNDQEFGRLFQIVRQEGTRVYLRAPLVKDLSLGNASHHGTVAEDFVQPPVGGVVRIRTTEGVGGWGSRIFSIENDLYQLVANHEGGRKTVRFIRGDVPPGQTVAAGSRTMKARALVPATRTPRDQQLRDIRVVGNYDAIQVSNVLYPTYDNVEAYVHRYPGGREGGLTINGDGSTGATFLRSSITGGGTGKMRYGQLARSTTNMRFDSCVLSALEITEFSAGIHLTRTTLSGHGTGEQRADRGVLSIGKTSGHTRLEDVEIRGSKVRSLIGSQDIQTYGATAGGGLRVRNLRLLSEGGVRTAATFNVVGLDIDGLTGVGPVYTVWGRLGAHPHREDKLPTEGPFINTIRNARWTGRWNQWASGDAAALRGQASGYWEGYYSEDRAFAEGRGTLWGRSQVEGERPYELKFTSILYGLPPGTVANKDVQYRGILADDDYLRFELLQPGGWPASGSKELTPQDTLICLGYCP